jgi:hypothetical protein
MLPQWRTRRSCHRMALTNKLLLLSPGAHHGKAVFLYGLRNWLESGGQIPPAGVLMAAINDVELSPFRFHGWLGKRLTASYGWRYHHALRGPFQHHPLIKRHDRGLSISAVGPRTPRLG